MIVRKINKIINSNYIMYYVKDMIFISPFRKFLIKLCIYTCIFGISLLIFWIPQIIINGNFILLENRQSRFPTDLKYILMWKSKKSYPFYRHPKLPEGQNVFIKQRCQYINCYLTYDKYLLREKHQNLDAVVFNVKDIVRHTPEDFYLTRSPDQIYIFNSLESSEKYPVCNSLYDNFFNWTWTYKLNSDIPQPLIKIYSNNRELVGPKRNMSWIPKMKRNNRFDRKRFNKTNAIAWVVPKCATKVKYQDFIGDLIAELKAYNYTLDIYGPCGNKKCNGGNLAKCYKMIENKYYFQLVLEDSLAEDYVSERMVQALSHIVIPVILGITDYKSFLPPGSYINAQSFDVKKIVAIFDYLMHYPSYYYFFDWKNHYYYRSRPKSEICSLCAKLNSNYTNISSPKVYKDFRKWWNPDYRDACHMSKNIFQAD